MLSEVFAYIAAAATTKWLVVFRIMPAYAACGSISLGLTDGGHFRRGILAFLIGFMSGAFLSLVVCCTCDCGWRVFVLPVDSSCELRLVVATTGLSRLPPDAALSFELLAWISTTVIWVSAAIAAVGSAAPPL